jgi:putative ABC transport system permease protein
VWIDLRIAFRRFRRQPSLSLITTLTLALGMGGAIAIFSIVNAVLLRDLPYPDADRLFVIRALAPDGGLGNVTRREFAPVYLEKDYPYVENAAIVWSQPTQMIGADGTPYLTRRYGVTDQFFKVFRSRMALGRGFEPDDVGGVVLSYAAWRDAFNSAPDIVGRVIQAESGQMRVFGVTAKEFEFPENPGFWYLMRLAPAYDNVRSYRGLIRVQPGVSREQVQATLNQLSTRLGPDSVTHQPPILIAQSMLDYIVGDLRSTVLILFGATGLLLAIASINVANLLLSRASARAREMALREAVGGTRWRLLRQLLTESVLLTAMGAVLGLGLAVAGTRLLMRLAPPELPRLDTVPIDARVILFGLGLTLAVGILVGLVPALRLLRNPLGALINEAGRGTAGGPARHWMFSSLVVTEIALAVLLVIASGLLVRSYLNLIGTDPGFNPDRLLTVTMNVPGHTSFSRTANPDGLPASPYGPMAEFFRDLESRIRSLPGVVSAASATTVPLTSVPSTAGTRFSIPGRPGGDTAEAPFAATDRAVSADFFRTMGIRFIAGRGFDSTDRPFGNGVAIVDDTFARRFFPGENPVGQRIHFPDNRWVPTDTGIQHSHRTVDDLQIIGVVADVRYVDLAQPSEPTIYLSSEQWIWRRRSIAVRVTGGPETLVAPIRSTITSMDAKVGAQFETYDSIMNRATARERLGMTLLIVFGAIAVVLAAVGVYGLMSYLVAQRAGEIAVRSAMGATAGNIVRLFLRRGAWLALTGVALGVAGAVVLREIVASQLYGVSSLDARVFTLVPVGLLAVALLACLIPSRRATRVHPADLLRLE